MKREREGYMESVHVAKCRQVLVRRRHENLSMFVDASVMPARSPLIRFNGTLWCTKLRPTQSLYV